MSINPIEWISPHAKALIMDLDGTLIDSVNAYDSSWNYILSKFNITVDKNYFSSMAGISPVVVIKDINRKFGAKIPAESTAKELESLVLKKLDNSKPIPYTVEMVKETDLPIALISGGFRSCVIKSLEMLNIKKLFKYIYSFDDIKDMNLRGKPHPDMFLDCANKLKILPQHCQVFEDGDPGLKAAKDAGMLSFDVRKYI